jgi:uncharacterized protein (TIGR00730 family)
MASSRLSSVSVYCASSSGVDPAFATAAAAVGRLLAERNVRLVYGGGHVGLMGILADAVLEQGGRGARCHHASSRTQGNRPRWSHDARGGRDDAERKALMADAADAFVMLPGGFGTWEEFLEALTWTQLGVHLKPCGVLNVAGFFDPLIALIDQATKQRFVRSEHRDLFGDRFRSVDAPRPAGRVGSP